MSSADVIAGVSADWHTDRRSWSRHPSATGDSLYALKQIVDVMVQYDCALIGAGDLFDVADPESYVVHSVLELVESLPKELLFVQGQHERSDPPWLSLSKKAIHLHGKSYKLGELLFAGWDYCPDFSKVHDELPECDILVTHQVWQEFMHRSVGCTGKLAALPDRIRTVITGDFHKTKVLHVPREHGVPVMVISPGSTHCRAVNEQKGKVVGLLRNNRSITWVDLDCRPIVEHKIPNNETLDWILAAKDEELFGKLNPKRPAHIAIPVISLKVSTGVTGASEKLAARFRDCHCHITLADEQELNYAGGDSVTVVDTSSVVMQCLADMVIDSKVRSDAGLLLNSANPLLTLDQLCRSFT